MATIAGREWQINAGQRAQLRHILLGLATGLLCTCTESPIAPTNRGILRLAPVFPAGARVAGLPLDNVRLVVVRPPGSTILDKSYSFPASQTQLAIDEAIPLQEQSELLQVTLTCLSGVIPLFRGSSILEVRQGPAAGPAFRLPLAWVGPGDEVTTISISPRDTVLTFDATLAFRVTASDAQGQNVAQFYVSWLSTDPGQLPDGDGVLRAGTTRTALQITATTQSGARDSTTVRVVPPPARLLATAGDDQIAPVGTRLAQPLEVEVRGSDDLPIPGVTVSFTPPSGGTVDTPRAVTDATGRARTGATLGPGSGPQNFTASAAGAGSVSFTATATPLALPTVSFTTASQTVSEGAGTATITAQLSGTATQTVTVPFTLTGTASNPADYTATAGPLTIAAGNTTATITVSLAADGLAEPDETVIATLTTPTNATLGPIPVHTLTIAGQVPTVSFTAASQIVGEGVGTATITAQLSSPSTVPVTVPFTLSGTATQAVDYTATGSPLTITPGNTTATITFTLVSDGVAEPDETVIATLDLPTNAALGPTTVYTLTIAGQVPTVSFTQATQSVPEGVVATITADLSSSSTQTVTVPFALTGTATDPADYSASTSPLVIPAGGTSATITVTIVADGVAEPGETVIATLGTPSNATLGPITVHTLIIAGQTPTLSFTAATQTVNEGVVATITAELSSAATQPVTVPFAVTGTATAPADYTVTTGPLVIAAGSTTATISVTVAADGVAEPDETVIATLGPPTNATLGATTVHTLTIAGQVPTVSFTAASQTVNEGVVATMTAQLSSASTQAVTVPFTLTGTASNTADYTATASPLTIAAGNTTATISVTVAADGVAEPDETVIATLGTPTNALLGAITAHTITIAGQVPTVSFTVATQTVAEGVGTATITAQLSSPSTQTVAIPFTVSGSASSPADYTIPASPLVIAAGNSSGTITVSVVVDGVAEPDETVAVTLGAPTNAALGAITLHTLTIIGQLPTVSFTTASQSVSEGGAVTITALLSTASTQTVTVPFSLTGTASNTVDYTTTASPLTIAAGNTTATITVTVTADGVDEPDETVIATLTAPTNAVLGATTAHILTILGQTPTVSFTAATQTVNEGVVATITAQLSSPSTQQVTVPFSTTGTATDPADYSITAGPLIIAPGNTTAAINVTIAADGVAEPLETVVVTLGTPINASVGAITVHTLNIAPQLPTVSFTAATQTVNEGAVATITAQLSGPSTQTVTVPFSLTGTASNGVDYTATAGPLTITAGNTTATISVTIATDGVAEPDETVVATLSTPTNAALGAITVHTLTIPGQTPTVSFTAASQIVNEGVVATITAQLSGPSTQTVTVPFNLTGTATNGADYTATASPLTIAAGNTTATISVTVAADGVAEPSETVVASLGTPINAALGAVTVHTVTIAPQVPTVSFSQATQLVNEGVVATITAQLSSPSTQQVTVPFSATGTATSPADYTITANPLVIAPGSSSGTISVTVLSDGVAEPNETVVVTMGTPTNAVAGAITVHTVNIAPQTPTVSFTAASQTVSEAVGTATITAQLSSPSTQAVSVPYSVTGTATSPADYSIAPNPVVIAAGSTSATISVTVVADGVAEPNETVVVTMGTPTNATPGATTVHTVTIAAQVPTVSFTVATQAVNEGVVATITAQLSIPSTLGVSVPFSLTGTATNTVDYTASATPLVIAAGNTSGTISVTVQSDSVAEPNETVVVTMGTPTNANLGAITVHTLIITGQFPTVTFTQSTQTVNEGVVATITGQISSPSTQNVTVPFTTSGTATNGADYTISASPLVIPAGKVNATISVTVVADPAAEPNETVVVTMGTPTNATLGAITVHTLTIASQQPVVSFTTTSTTVGEPQGAATLTVQLSATSTQTITVPFTVGGTATSGADYIVNSPNPVSFPPGSRTQSIILIVVNNTLGEPNETAVVTLGTPSNATLGSPSVHTVTITDDDAHPPVLSNIRYVQAGATNTCNIFGGPLGTAFRVTFTYVDAGGDVIKPGARDSVSYQFRPQGTSGGFDDTAFSTFTGTGFSGTIAADMCFLFGPATTTSVDVSMFVTDIAGTRSAPILVNILRPVNANGTGDSQPLGARSAALPVGGGSR